MCASVLRTGPLTRRGAHCCQWRVRRLREMTFMPGKDYPVGPTHPPELPFDCSKFQYPGYYVDYTPASRCQVFHRCDLDGVRTSYICPNMTLFNQITLVCDWFFNVGDCRGQGAFDTYSNGRLTRQDLLLFDDKFSYEVPVPVAPVQMAPVQKPYPITRRPIPLTTKEPKFFKCITKGQCAEIEIPSEAEVKKDGIKINVSNKPGAVALQ